MIVRHLWFRVSGLDIVDDLTSELDHLGTAGATVLDSLDLENHFDEGNRRILPQYSPIPSLDYSRSEEEGLQSVESPG